MGLGRLVGRLYLCGKPRQIERRAESVAVEAVAHLHGEGLAGGEDLVDEGGEEGDLGGVLAGEAVGGELCEGAAEVEEGAAIG